jgi:hypothetical protein
MPENKIVVNVDSWGTIHTFTVETSDPEFVLSAIEKLKPALPRKGPLPKTTQI